MDIIDGVLVGVNKEDIEFLNKKSKKFWKGVTSIGDSAFSGCESLTNITIPDGVTSIQDRAFSVCKSLTNIKIPEDVINIER